MLTTYVLTFILFSVNYGTRDDYYPNWMGVLSNEVTGVDGFGSSLADLRIIDVVLPGSHHAGMYPEAIAANGHLTSADTFYSNVIAFTDTLNTDRLTAWTKRQHSSVLEQLESGSRFLDIRLEKTSAGETYAHNGVLGATFDTILADIKTFLDASTSFDSEIIILSFSDFLDVDANAIFTTMQTQLSSHMQPVASYNISSDTIATLLTAGIRVIPFFDGVTTSGYVHDANTRFAGVESEEAIGTVAVSEVISGLVSGWDTSTANGQMNLVYYVLNIAAYSDYTKYSNLYKSFAEYSAADLMITLSNTIRNYPKLYFGNAIIVDFVQSSNVIDEVITLNYNYFDCRDPVENWGDANDCPTLTDLSRDYKTSDISSPCQLYTSLATTCERSCGGCSWRSGVPGSSCAADADCDSELYQTTGATGTCFKRDDDWESFIKEETFCLAPYAFEDCGSKSTDVCAGDAAVDSECTSLCSSDFQCSSGYCDTSSGVCLGFEFTTTTTRAPSTERYWPHVISEEATSWRDYLAGYRPGDPDAPYEFVQPSGSDPMGMVDANPYIKSLLGFVVIPMVLAIIMFVGYSMCCPCWCCCTKCCKKCCCKCCLGDTDESAPARWIPTVLMLTTLIIILWGIVEGVTANGEMHDHIFAKDQDSLRTEMLGLFDTVLDKFEGIKPEASWIVGNVKTILGSVGGIVSKVESGTANDIKAIYNAFNLISKNYDGYSIEATVSTPFDLDGNGVLSENISLPCDYCQGLGTQISDINNTFKSAVSIISNLQSMLNSTDGLVSAEEAIDTAVGQFNQMVDNFTSMIATARDDTEGYLDDFEGYDAQREQALSAFFGLWIVFIILWVIGVIFGLINAGKDRSENKCMNQIGECFFKCTWCNSMWFGAIVMLIFSLFAIISVGWADLCWNLDQFEADPEGSNLGQTIADLTGNGTGGMNPVQLVNACWTGADLLDTLNLTDKLDWSSFRDNMTDVLDMDITKELTLDALDSFVAEINLLNTDEFEVEGDKALAALNGVGGACVCDCAASHGTPAAEFTRAKVDSGECHNATADKPRGCWDTSSSVVAGPGYAADLQVALTQYAHCVANFTTFYTFYQAEKTLVTETNQAIDDIKNYTGIILQAYDGIFGVAVDIENSVKNISCSIDPIFERFDALIQNYSNCGFLGEAYGGFKNVGCVLLFGDMYGISKGMMIIAFTSIAAVFFGCMSEYSWYPVKDGDDEDDDPGAKLMKSVSSRFGINLPGSGDEDEMANEMELATKQTPDENAEGVGEGNNPPEPEGPPPQQHDTTIPVEVNETGDNGSYVPPSTDGASDEARDEAADPQPDAPPAEEEEEVVPDAPSAPTDFEAEDGDVL